MVQVAYPGVYVEEVSSGVRPIAAASTSIAAFIGVAEKGLLGKAVRVYNFTEYQNKYGGFLGNSFLSHSVYQFFNNGGSQCSIIRVSGENTESAAITLNDRGLSAQASLIITASSPGVWGNRLAVLITNGTNDTGDKTDNLLGNEFDLTVFMEGETSPLERFQNLTMVPGAANFVETVISASKYIRVAVNQATTNFQAGTSRGSGVPTPLAGTGRTWMRINVNGDGYQEIHLEDALGAGPGQVADLATDANIAVAIVYVVTRLTKQRASTNQNAFDNFACVVDSGVLLLTSGLAGLTSAVNIAPSVNGSQNCTALLNLGTLEEGVETGGAAIIRPRNNPAGTPPDNFFLVGDNAAPTADVAAVTAGSDGDPINNDQAYIEALQLLNDVDDVSLISVPGIGSSAVVGAGINYCANRSLSDCFFIGDMSQDDDTVDEAKTFMAAISPKNSYGAVYLPWVKMLDPTGISPDPILAPPSGFVAGLYAKTDGRRGVWKAPAGTEAALGNALGLAANFTDVQQGNLNPLNINVIRQFASSGIILWGARTISSDPEWHYVPVRRMGIFLRVSIYRGIQWAVFEPNDVELWSSLRLNISSFMMTLYRQGAFQGSMPSAAFFVKCDGETTTQDDINAGIVNVLVGFAPLKPAEFVIVKISQKAGQTV
ncbi:MAG: phage tail sheath family protein [Desulfocapsa sp.]|nr:phage tail sheath family protein [Desulfocapsa sp.]